jgi:hypothetical protein
VPYNADAYHSFNRDRDKTILTTSDVDLFLPLDSVQITRPVDAPQPASTNPPLICLAGSKYTRTAQHAIPPQHPAHPFDFFHAAPILTHAPLALRSDTNSSSISEVAQAIHSVSDVTSLPPNLPAIPHECTNAMLCSLSCRHLACPPDFNHTRAHTSNATRTLLALHRDNNNSSSGSCNNSSSSNDAVSIVTTTCAPSTHNPDFDANTLGNSNNSNYNIISTDTAANNSNSNSNTINNNNNHISNSNNNPDNNSSFIDITHVFHTHSTDSNSNSNNNNNSGLVNIACTINTDSTNSKSNSNSNLHDTANNVDSDTTGCSALPAPLRVTTNQITSVPASHLSTLASKSPHSRHLGQTRQKNRLQLLRRRQLPPHPASKSHEATTGPLSSISHTPSDLSDNALARFSGKAYCFALPADDFGDRKCLRHVDPGGSKFKPPGRCKVCLCCKLRIIPMPTPHRCLPACPGQPIGQFIYICTFLVTVLS